MSKSHTTKSTSLENFRSVPRSSEVAPSSSRHWASPRLNPRHQGPSVQGLASERSAQFVAARRSGRLRPWRTLSRYGKRAPSLIRAFRALRKLNYATFAGRSRNCGIPCPIASPAKRTGPGLTLRRQDRQEPREGRVRAFGGSVVRWFGSSSNNHGLHGPSQVSSLSRSWRHGVRMPALLLAAMAALCESAPQVPNCPLAQLPSPPLRPLRLVC